MPNLLPPISDLIPKIILPCVLSLTFIPQVIAQIPEVSAEIQKLERGTTQEKQAAMDRLVSLGKNAVPQLITAAEHQNPQVRVYAIQALGQIGADAGAAVPVLSRALKDTDKSVRQAAAQALNRLGKAALVPYLVQGLSDPNPTIRYNSAHSLSRLGKDATAAVPHLIKTLQDEDMWVRLTAAYALGGIGVDAAPAMSALVDSLGDRDDSVRHSVAYAIGNIGWALSEQGSQLSNSELEQTIKYLETAFKLVSRPNPKFRPEAIKSIQTPLQTLKKERSSRLRKSQIERLLAILNQNRLI